MIIIVMSKNQLGSCRSPMTYIVLQIIMCQLIHFVTGEQHALKMSFLLWKHLKLSHPPPEKKEKEKEKNDILTLSNITYIRIPKEKESDI